MDQLRAGTVRLAFSPLRVRQIHRIRASVALRIRVQPLALQIVHVMLVTLKLTKTALRAYLGNTVVQTALHLVHFAETAQLDCTQILLLHPNALCAPLERTRPYLVLRRVRHVLKTPHHRLVVPTSQVAYVMPATLATMAITALHVMQGATSLQLDQPHALCVLQDLT